VLLGVKAMEVNVDDVGGVVQVTQVQQYQVRALLHTQDTVVKTTCTNMNMGIIRTLDAGKSLYFGLNMQQYRKK